MAIGQQVKSGLRHLVQPLSAGWNRALAKTAFRPGLSGAYPDLAAALVAVPTGRKSGYDHSDLAEVSFAKMCELQLWDYPVLYWLARLARPGFRLVDAGGHLGTRYIAFAEHLDLGGIDWTVQDLPAIIAEARQRQAAGELPAAIRFESDLAACPEADLLLASGLLQYFDRPVRDLLLGLSKPPRHIILNKVATRDGDTVVTLERIGPSLVPYQIRSRAAFEAEIAAVGYRVIDQWEIRSLAHVIPTHPSLGASRSLGYVLKRQD